ncbi:MAG: co-chaperone GroES [bacterium]
MSSKDKGNNIPVLPINGRIVILPEEKQKVTASGLYLADSSSSSDKPQVGTVIRVGLERVDDEGNKIPFNVKDGMRVLFKKYTGDEIEWEGVKYILLEERDIMAIFED